MSFCFFFFSLSNGEESILKSSRNHNTNDLRIRIEDLERVRRMPRDGTVISLREQPPLLLILVLLRPQLEAALEVEEVLVALWVDMRQYAQRIATGRIGAHQRKCIAR